MRLKDSAVRAGPPGVLGDPDWGGSVKKRVLWSALDSEITCKVRLDDSAVRAGHLGVLGDPGWGFSGEKRGFWQACCS